MTNCDANGIRYSYFSFNDLAPWCLDDLFYGNQAKDLSYEEAITELKAQARREFAHHLEAAEIAAAEVDPNMPEQDRQAFIERWFEEVDVVSDEEDYVALFLDRNLDSIMIEEPIIEGELDGVHYRIS